MTWMTSDCRLPAPSFDAIAARYDFLNRVLSLGLDGKWRKKAVAALELLSSAASPARVLDLATGTGDLALAVARACPTAEVIGVDPSPRMLDRAREKAKAAGARIRFLDGAAESLPFSDGALDGATIAFGIRNVADRPRALAELGRVLRRGGRLVVLELGEPRRGPLAPFARFWVHVVVPLIGGWLARAPDEYRYLARSMARFPPPDAFACELREAGFTVEKVTPLVAGVAHLFVASRP